MNECVEELFSHHDHIDSDSNLKFITARLNPENPQFGAANRDALGLYRSVLQGKTVKDEPRSPAHNELKLSGLVRVSDSGTFTSRNRIYDRVFDKKWINNTLSGDRVLEVTTRRVATTSAALTFVASLVVFSLWFLYFQPNQIASELDQVSSDTAVAENLHARLSRFPGWQERANELLARYWSRRDSELSDIQRLDLLRAYELEPSAYRRLKLENVQTGIASDSIALISTMRHISTVNSATFSADGKRVVTASSDNTARLWDSASGALIHTLAHDSVVISAAVSADSERVVTASSDNTCLLYTSPSPRDKRQSRMPSSA